MLDEVLAQLEKMTPTQIANLQSKVNQVVPKQIWYPHPDNEPQCKAYYSKADITLFGGSPGGGKTALGLGLAITQHTRSLVVRKQFTDLDGVIDNLAGMIGTNKGIVRGNRPKYKNDDRVIYFQGMGTSGDIDTGKQGNAFDFIYIDEGAQFPEADVRLLIGWNRRGAGVPESQRCRILIGSNPPTNSTGDWLGTFFAPWFDPRHPNPAKFGELRWFYFDKDGKSVETEHKEPFEIDGEKFYPHSRTYIFSAVENNPYLDSEEYKKKLQTIPEPFRSQLLSGNFLAARKDQEAQVIPTAWVQMANERWNKANGLPPQGIPMCNIGSDCAGGGNDEAVLSPRYDHHFAKLTKFKTVVNEYGSQTAAEIIKIRRHNSDVTLDMGGGYGSGAYIILKENIGTDNLKSYQGGAAAEARTEDGKLSFLNLRSQLYWQLREALDPDQDGGSLIELPPDPRLLAGLTAPTFEIRGTKICVESAEKVKEKLGYSPNEAAAVIMSWWKGKKFLTQEGGLQSFYKSQPFNQPPSSNKMMDKYQHRRGI